MVAKSIAFLPEDQSWFFAPVTDWPESSLAPAPEIERPLLAT